MIIEKLKKEELDKYKKLIDEAFDGSNDIEKYEEYDENSDIYEVLVLKEKNEIIGTVTMYKIQLFTFGFQPSIELFNVAVSKAYRRKNLGSIMLKYVIEYAKENGFKSIHFTCLESEEGVHQFYESMGFVKANSRKYNMNL